MSRPMNQMFFCKYLEFNIIVNKREFLQWFVFDRLCNLRKRKTYLKKCKPKALLPFCLSLSGKDFSLLCRRRVIFHERSKSFLVLIPHVELVV